jgi:hypothetical protein
MNASRLYSASSQRLDISDAEKGDRHVTLTQQQGLTMSNCEIRKMSAKTRRVSPWLLQIVCTVAALVLSIMLYAVSFRPLWQGYWVRPSVIRWGSGSSIWVDGTAGWASISVRKYYGFPPSDRLDLQNRLNSQQGAPADMGLTLGTLSSRTPFVDWGGLFEVGEYLERSDVSGSIVSQSWYVGFNRRIGKSLALGLFFLVCWNVSRWLSKRRRAMSAFPIVTSSLVDNTERSPEEMRAEREQGVVIGLTGDPDPAPPREPRDTLHPLPVAVHTSETQRDSP